MQRYLINSVLNMRDIGGYETEERRIVKQNVIIRSNCPTGLSKSDLDYIKKLGIKNIIDLRNIEEIQRKPSSFAADNYFDYFNLEIIGGRNIPESSEQVPVSYIKMLEDNETNFYKIFTVLKDAKGGTIFFCNAGKDRTGVLTALIHLLLKVNEKDIIANYILTSVYLNDFLENYINETKNEKLRNIIIPKQEFMQEFLKTFKEKYDTIEFYLEKIGFSQDDLKLIKDKYLE